MWYENETQKRRNFKDRERNAGVEPEDTNWIRKQKNDYLKVGNSFIKVIYYSPDMGPCDGKTYIKRKDGMGYVVKR